MGILSKNRCVLEREIINNSAPCVSGSMVSKLLECLANPDPSWGGVDGEILRLVNSPWQRAYQVEYRYNPSKIFADYLGVIESATYDLMVGNYVCAYISLIPVVEAALRAWDTEKPEIRLNGKDDEFNMKIFSKSLIDYLREKNIHGKSNPKFQQWISNQIKYFEFIMGNVFYLRFKDSEEGVHREFNRNRTLHLLDGVQDPLILRDNVIRIFLLLDIIAELYLSLDDDLYAENTFCADYEENINFNLRWKIYLKNAMELINLTDMTIIKLAFLNKDDNLAFSDDKKKKFIEQKEHQIEFLSNRS